LGEESTQVIRVDLSTLESREDGKSTLVSKKSTLVSGVNLPYLVGNTKERKETIQKDDTASLKANEQTEKIKNDLRSRYGKLARKKSLRSSG